MAGHAAPNIVEDGLVFYVDPMNLRSYVSGSETTFSLFPSSSIKLTGSLINDVSGSMGNKSSFNFDGVGDYIQLPTASFLSSATALTISYWGYAASNGNTSIMGYKNPSNWEGVQLFTSTYNGGTVFFRCMGETPQNKYVLGTLTDNSGWHHYVGVYNYGDVGDRYMKCYIDGQQSGNTYTSPPAYTWSQTGDNFRIGNEGSTYTNGDMSCIMMYNRALSAQEVKQNYNALKGRFN